MGTFAIESALRASADEVFRRATTFEGVNAELGPYLQMTGPRDLTLRDAPIGKTLFRSWLLLFGVLPIDFDDIALAAVSERSFSERSTMLSMARWEHDRTVDPRGGGCVVRDELRWTPRVPGTDALLGTIVRATFRHRHRRLRAIFGA